MIVVDITNSTRETLLDLSANATQGVSVALGASAQQLDRTNDYVYSDGSQGANRTFKNGSWRILVRFELESIADAEEVGVAATATNNFNEDSRAQHPASTGFHMDWVLLRSVVWKTQC